MDYIPKEEYIFDVEPQVPKINLEELINIQYKLEDYTSGKSTDGLTVDEARKFLDWVTLNARNYAVKSIPVPITKASMTGQCAPTQEINTELLSKFGLDVRPFNTGNCIGEIPMNELDRKRIENGWGNSIALRHAVSVVSIPMINQSGYTQTYDFVLDPTFRQFCLTDNCTTQAFYDKNRIEKGILAPRPGYFMKRNNLLQLGESEEVATKSEMLCEEIISKGYFYLNEENAKLYGDAFVKASKRAEFQYVPINMTGADYKNNFKNDRITTLGRNDGVEYTKLPNERIKPKSLFAKLADFIKQKLGKSQPKALPEGRGETNAQYTNANSWREQLEVQVPELGQQTEASQYTYGEYDQNYLQQNDGMEQDL